MPVCKTIPLAIVISLNLINGHFPLVKTTKDKLEKMLRTWYSIFKCSYVVF